MRISFLRQPVSINRWIVVTAPAYVRLPLSETSPNTSPGRMNSASVRNRSRLRLVRSRLLGMPEGELLALEPETCMEGIVFRALSAPGSGFPDEAAALATSRLEEEMVEVHAIESVGEVLAGGNPESSASGEDGDCGLAEISKGCLTPSGSVRAGGERYRGNLQGSDDPARKHDPAPDTRYGWILAIPAGATRLRLRLRGGRTR